jgi:hypothetical protein
MASESISAHELAALVKPVRALLTKNNKIAAIRLVRERTESGLRESKEFVEHVESWPAARAQMVAELWVRVASGEVLRDGFESVSMPMATPEEQLTGRREPTNGGHLSLADWYAQYMETHTYSDWEQLVKQCLAAKTTEEEL